MMEFDRILRGAMIALVVVGVLIGTGIGVVAMKLLGG